MQTSYLVIACLVIITAWQIYQARWSPLAQAKRAVKAVLIKQGADIASIVVRTDLMLQRLSNARTAHADELQNFEKISAQLGQNLDREGEIVRSNAYSRVLQKQKELESATTMVRSFEQSFAFFVKKWSEQASFLSETFPVVLEQPQKSGLQELLQLPNAMAGFEARLKETLSVSV